MNTYCYRLPLLCTHRYDAESRAQGGQGHGGDVHPIDYDPTADQLLYSEYGIHHAAFARPYHIHRKVGDYNTEHRFHLMFIGPVRPTIPIFSPG